jgi:hypothetical protein
MLVLSHGNRDSPDSDDSPGTCQLNPCLAISDRDSDLPGVHHIRVNPRVDRSHCQGTVTDSHHAMWARRFKFAATVPAR